MMKQFMLLFSAFSMVLLFSCGTQQEEDKTDEQVDTMKTEQKEEKKKESKMSGTMEKDGLKVYPKTNSPSFENSTISSTYPTNGANIESGEVEFTYDISNYELGIQTDKQGGLANSKDGQHIHAILNNKPYMAKYEPKFTKELEDGHYVLLSFLSRSYHESVKSDDAYDLIQFSVGDAEAEQADLSAPHMFYSRPKGTYSGMDAQKLLLDWYLVNCDLSENGHKVRATVNGTEFTFTKWQPYVIEGLPMGEVSIKIELLDADGNLVDSPFNPEERTVTLEEAEKEM
jgi:hypothetical protein